MPKISVILVTYNRDYMVCRMIEDILNQTFEEFELIIINNGSNDNTDLLCKKYARRDKRIKYIHILENKGASGGRNKGIANSGCDYLCVVDDDDRCKPEMLETIWNLAQDHHADIAICGSYSDYGDRIEPYFIDDKPYVLNRSEGLRELLKREKYNVAPPTKLFKKHLWKGLLFPENVLVDDIHVIYKVFEQANIIAGHNIGLYNFTKHDSNMTAFIHQKKMTPKLLEEYVNMYETRANYLMARVPEIKNDIENSVLLFMKSMCSKIETGEAENCDKYYNYMKNYIKNMEENKNGQ